MDSSESIKIISINPRIPVHTTRRLMARVCDFLLPAMNATARDFRCCTDRLLVGVFIFSIQRRLSIRMVDLTSMDRGQI